MINFYRYRLYNKWGAGLAMLMLLAFGATAPLQAQSLVWEENFEGTTINPETWTFDFGDGCERGICGWGNQELQYYTSRPKNARIEDGSLVIEALRENFQGKAFTSARLKTVGRVHLKYGTLEARIKVPDLENGLWPAFWMLGTTGNWPSSGEIDIMEMGNASAIQNNVVNRRVGAATHWENNETHASYGEYYDTPADLNDGYHLYKMSWDSEFIRVFVDDHLFYTIDIRAAAAADLEEFHKQQYILLNLAVGGSYTGIMNAAGITAPLPAKMYVDYIKLYQNAGDELYLGKENALAGNFGIYSESASMDSRLAYGQEAELYIWNNLAPIAGAVPYEGDEVLALRAASGNWFGFGVDNKPKNLLNYADGFLKFHFKTTYAGQFKIGVKSGHGESWINFPAGAEQWGLLRDGQWHEVSIPLSTFNNPNMGMHIDLGSMTQLFMFAGDPAGANADFYFDNIYYSGGVAANPAPAVALTAPANDATFATGEPIEITATASDANGSVSKVDFYQGNTLLGTDATAPYSLSWADAPAGVYTLLAKATDNEGGVGTSSSVRIFVAAGNNQAPTVSITSPAEGATFTKPATIAIAANAADADGSVYKVEFYNGATLLGTDFTSPYSYNWAGVMPGTYAITAKVTDNGNLEASSAAVNVTVVDNAIVADAYGIFTDQAAITTRLTLGVDANLYVWNNLAAIAGATPQEGSNVLAFTAAAGNWFGMGIANDARNLQHFANGTLKFHMKTSSTATFKVGINTAGGESWVNFIAGQNQWGLVRDGEWHEVVIPMSAFTNKDLTNVSQVFMFAGDAPATAADFFIDNVYYSAGSAGNTAPSVSISAPANNATFAAPASITITANATDAEGAVAKVDFYNGDALLGTDERAPFSFSWNAVGVGTYTLTAKATDGGGLESTSAAITITVEEGTSTGPNLALNKPVTVSSVENEGTPGAAAVDGNLTTRWSSAFADPQWLAVDLGKSYAIDQVKITWEPAFASHYEVQVSEDGQRWTTAKTISGNTTHENNHTQLGATGRYVRIWGTQRATPYGYSIYELEVYGSEPSTYCGTAENGDYSYKAETAGEAVTFTFHPLDEVAGGNLAIIYIREGASGAYPGYTMVKNSDGDFTYTKTIAAGTVTSIYFTYQVGAGGVERNSAATPHSYTVGTSCTGGGEGGNAAPTVALTAPVHNATYAAPASILLTATAADADGEVTKVEFYQGSDLLATAVSSPYSASWENVAAGNYTITAVAYDNEGASTTSAAVSVAVTGGNTNPSTYCGTAANGDFAFSATTADGMVTITFHPLAPIAGSNFALLYVKPTAQAGGYPGYPMTASGTDFTHTIPAPAAGTELSLYFTYRISENGPERNSADSPNTYVVGSSCGIQTCENVFYADADGDGFGDGAASVTACEAPAGYVDRDGDCNDADASINPDGVDLCDGIDRNCDGVVRQPMAAPVISVTPSSSVYTGGDATTLYLGYGPNSVTLAASSTAAASYTWMLNGATVSTKASTVFKPTAAGTYTFTATAMNGDKCTASVEQVIRVIDARAGQKGNLIAVCHEGAVIAVDKKSVQAHLAHGDGLGSCNNTTAIQARMGSYSQAGLAVYPNPAGATTQIQFQLAKGERYSLALYDLRGALVKTIASGSAAYEGNHSQSFGVDGIAKGVYLIKLTSGTNVAAVRLVIQR